ncbi:SpoIIE family protein phosphatase [Hymenobacter sp. BT664]|uniref:SpoIIE family protein phosphatase n=1 Tax=Hymenobacter montanus TaxID=2771359 RepID=A0A927BBJ0_9BACT|nr:SpoIIE family protein phosphatase [Hymenobacter montanus]MBD2767072.1 SpoIIE family protein phosphatase [Hymenobacter montanus]
MPQRFLSLLLPLSLLSWVALLLSALSHSGADPWLGRWPEWATQLTQGIFVLSIFLHYRYQPSPLQGQAFVRLLRRLVVGPGLLALGCVGLHLFERLAKDQPIFSGNGLFFTSIYTLNLGLFVIFLARTNYAWRALVLFRSSTRLQREWTLFEILLGATLLFRLVGVNPPNYLGIPIVVTLGLYGVYLSGHQKWVAYLSQRDKWRAALLQAVLLFGVLVFVQYFRLTQYDPQLIAPEAQYAFLLLTAFFSAFYALMGLLVTFFNMPIADIIEQRRNEILRLQRLTQIIQRGQTSAEVYHILLESAVQTVQAEAAWLDLEPGQARLDAAASTFYHNLLPTQADALREQLKGHELPAGKFITNGLNIRLGVEGGTPRVFRSLLQLPLRGLHYTYGMLHLLKVDPHTFDREDLNILQTFTSQAVLSIENLELVRTSLENQRTQEELKIASQVQNSLIPKNLPTDNWFDISSHSLAAKEVGGDFYDFLHLPGRRLAVIIGDVSGKGVTAAFHMAQMKGIFHSLMQENPLAKTERDKFPVPSRFMAQANAALVHCLEKSSFITSSLYIIDYEQGGFVFARAGHCHTLYYHAMREEVFYFESTGLGLGIIRNETYEKHIKNQFYDYSPGDVMVIYTDGIVEARGDGGAEYGEDRLKQRLEECYYLAADEIKSFILNDLNAFTKGYPIHDDQTLLVIKFKSAQPPPLA